jgi:NagD protein
MIAAIEACTGTRVEAVVGKPNETMVEAVLHLLESPIEGCLIIGDRLETDVLLGLNAGMAAALVLTGATDESSAASSEIEPTYVINNLAELLYDQS